MNKKIKVVLLVVLVGALVWLLGPGKPKEEHLTNVGELCGMQAFNWCHKSWCEAPPARPWTKEQERAWAWCTSECTTRYNQICWGGRPLETVVSVEASDGALHAMDTVRSTWGQTGRQ